LRLSYRSRKRTTGKEMIEAYIKRGVKNEKRKTIFYGIVSERLQGIGKKVEDDEYDELWQNLAICSYANKAKV
jgi:hypothetical protein